MVYGLDSAAMRQRLGTLAIVAFVVIDVVLVVLAFRHVRPANGSGAAPASPSASPTGAPSTSASAGSPSEAPSKSASASHGPLLLSLAADGTVLRATEGDCAGKPARITVSTNGGRTFTRVQVAADLDQVLSVEARSKRDLRLVGSTDVCTTRLYDGAAGRQAWKAGDDSGTWHQLIGDSSAVRSPSGVVDTPCRPVDVSATATVRLLCANKSIIGTDDDGQSWVTLGSLPGAKAISFVTPTRGYAVASRPECQVDVLTTDDGGATWDEASCLGIGSPRAIAAHGDVALVQAGDSLLRSEDSGVSWETLP